MPDVNNLANKAALNTKAVDVESKVPDITNLATKPALNSILRRLKKFLTFDLSYFYGGRYFDDDELQNYLVSQSFFKTLRMLTGDTETITT